MLNYTEQEEKYMLHIKLLINYVVIYKINPLKKHYITMDLLLYVSNLNSAQQLWSSYIYIDPPILELIIKCLLL
ncbi:uncharacterized protein DS421_17g600370 [Arachis hypogaea]|nr:uncharacterized protein DS421_17g600370 [Arachis hypogaea]